MKTAPVVPAQIAFGDDGEPPFAPVFGDRYHPHAGALAQARSTFLAGNGLPQRWQGRDRFVILEAGFGLGHNFLATWQAWRDDARRCGRLVVVSIDLHPPTRADLARAHAASPLCALADALVAAWPPLTPNLHTLAFDHGGVTLQLAFGDIAQWLPEVVAEVDAIYLDGFAPARNPAMWDARVGKALARLASHGATAATWSAARGVRDMLAAAGFSVDRVPGASGKTAETRARFEPPFIARRPPGRTTARDGDVLVIGAGLAGASAAWALAAAGRSVRVIDAAATPAQGASGNAAGLFHGTLHPDDGIHARFNRAAALEAARVLAPLVRSGAVPGRADGLLRLGAEEDVPGLPPDYVQRLGADEAAARCGWPVGTPGWLYAGGGWIDPSALVRHWLAHDGVRFKGGHAVHTLRTVDGRWQALDATGDVIASADNVVLANAHDAARLAGAADWPLERLRGQITRLPPGVVPPPALPIASGGYAIGLPDGSLWCGATSDANDDDPTLRPADHRRNLERLAQLRGAPVPEVDVDWLEGRVGWRCAARDRLPIVGAVAAEGGTHLTQPRNVPRVPGLFVCTALGSRGITASVLCARVLAAWITGAPQPLEASLLDAIDPARYVSRRVRKASS